ncbi:MAG: hypothetical protein NT019_03005 [Candidatus Adlerbacteria bacterium]|nr:hypothetical protein [Candidatus Adlerbacteria bacterium]
MEVFKRVAQATCDEPHLLATSAEDLLTRYNNGLSMLGFWEGDVVFHTCLTPLLTWFELGGTWTRADLRGKKINQAAYKRFLPGHAHRNILVTTTSIQALRVGTHFSFVVIPRTWLPPAELAATCICSAQKTGSMEPSSCTLAWREPQQRGPMTCYVRVTPETAQRMGWEANWVDRHTAA